LGRLDYAKYRTRSELDFGHLVGEEEVG